MGNSFKKSASEGEAVPPVSNDAKSLKKGKRKPDATLASKAILKKPKKKESEKNKELAMKPAPSKASKDDDLSSDKKELAIKPAAYKESKDDDSSSDKKNSYVEIIDAERKSNANLTKTPSTPTNGGSKTIFVANLPIGTTEADLVNFFRDAGEVVVVRFATNDDGRHMSFGHVKFATAEAAEQALTFHGMYLHDNVIHVDTPCACERCSGEPEY